MLKNNEYDCIIIGGGAAGMMVASIASSRKKKILLIEKNNDLGEKLKITGGGRCNICNAIFDNRELLKNYGDAEPFLYSSFSQFDVKKTFDFFEKNGLDLITEERNRVFPKSQKAIDVLDLFKKLINNEYVTIKTNCPVEKIIFDKNKITEVKTKCGIFSAKNYVVATGGLSHPETGSTGDGFLWLKDMGHDIKDSTPNVVPVSVAESWIKKISGNTLSDMKITFYLNDEKKFSRKGNILFTHFGLSGPLIMNSSYKIADLLHQGKVTAKIDCFPNKNISQLEKEILEMFDKNKNKDYKNIIKDIVPKGLADTFLDFNLIDDKNKKVNSITKEERRKIIDLLKSMPATITGLMGMDKAIVSDGGVLLEEIDTKTMRSKKIDNLFLTGDILNINRPSGGFSLQLCWTTGYIVGINI